MQDTGWAWPLFNLGFQYLADFIDFHLDDEWFVRKRTIDNVDMLTDGVYSSSVSPIKMQFRAVGDISVCQRLAFVHNNFQARYV